MPESEPKRSRIAAAKERTEKAKTVILAAAVLAFFGAMAVERGAHHSTSSGSRPAVTSDESDDFGFFDNGGLSPSQGQPSTSTQTS
jgi:hypothetical protein